MVLPIAAFVCLWCLTTFSQKEDWRVGFLKAALAWCERINGLSAEQRQSAPWHYVLLAENVVLEWQAKGARLAELLHYARLRPLASAALQQVLI